MQIIQPDFEILTLINPSEIYKSIERAGRTAYKSEYRITDSSAVPFVKMIVRDLKHESVIEHVSLTVKIICNRAVSHELVRHRLASYTQESTRYVNYGKKNGEITVIDPSPFFEKGSAGYNCWKDACLEAEKAYLDLINSGCSPQAARLVLPQSLKTEIVVTANLREWRHIFKLRCSKAAFPQIRLLMTSIRDRFTQLLEPVFGDLTDEKTET